MSLHLSPVRHIFLALLYLLISGGGEAVFAFSVPAHNDLAPAQISAAHSIGVSLHAISPGETPTNFRPAEGRFLAKIPLSVWADSYTPPILQAARFAMPEIAPQNPRLRVSPRSARAPPSCL